jgi:ferredoxin
MNNFVVAFEGCDMQPVVLKSGSLLSEHLTIQNSPILFGCRIGICGTCSIEVSDTSPEMPPRTHEEQEFLETLAPDRPNYRLACQIRINSDLKIKKVEI